MSLLTLAAPVVGLLLMLGLERVEAWLEAWTVRGRRSARR
jgi:hypothetical protein